MKSLKRFEGWLLLDHSSSPGIPADIARSLGLPPKSVASGKVLECATLTCKHCGTAWRKNPYRVRPREYCRKCDHYICDPCGREAAQPGYIHRCKEQKVDQSIGV